MLLPQECQGVPGLMSMLQSCRAGGSGSCPDACAEMLSLAQEWGLSVAHNCCVDAASPSPVPSNLLTQPCLPPTPSRYLHLPLSNHFFLWLLKLTHFDILRGEKWEVLLEIALMCCAGEALLEEQAQNPL